MTITRQEAVELVVQSTRDEVGSQLCRTDMESRLPACALGSICLCLEVAEANITALENAGLLQFPEQEK